MRASVLRGVEDLIRGRKKMIPAQARQVLVLEFRLPLGCLVHMTPAFEAMKQSPPSSGYNRKARAASDGSERHNAVSLARQMKGAVFTGLAAVERRARPSSRKPLAGARNFLLLQYPTALGTAVHATPMVAGLRAAMPGCSIAVAASGFALEIFRNNPAVDWLIQTPSPLQRLKEAILSLRRQMPFGGEEFVAVTTVGNERTRIAIPALLCGSSARVGFTEAPEIYRAALQIDPQRSLIDNNLRILEALGHPFRHFEPQTFAGEQDLEWARRALAENGVRKDQLVAVFVTQTSVTQRKSWRAQRFQAAAQHLIDRHRAHIVFVGTAVEAGAIDELRSGISGATSSVAGKTTLLQLSALLSLCGVGLTLDTGTLHMGRTVGLPMVVIAPAWSPIVEWLPLENPRYRILKNADMATCPPDYVIDEVSVEEVTAALDALIAEYPEGALGQKLRSALGQRVE